MGFGGTRKTRSLEAGTMHGLVHPLALDTVCACTLLYPAALPGQIVTMIGFVRSSVDRGSIACMVARRLVSRIVRTANEAGALGVGC
jgi:hypothetical protein